MDLNSVFRFHQEWFYFAVISCGVVGVWGLVLAAMKRDPSRWFSYMRAVAIAAILVQIGSGVSLYANGREPVNSFHMFYVDLGVFVSIDNGQTSRVDLRHLAAVCYGSRYSSLDERVARTVLQSSLAPRVVRTFLSSSFVSRVLGTSWWSSSLLRS
ncbi:MAG: hypothetical protein O3B42_06750 [Actinomycetota bacterium]|nr:hypothetical protein [Actinomycetota bacterium]